MDLDNLWSYLKIHGDRGWETFPSFFNFIIPAVLAVLSDLDLKITFFVVGRDASLEKNHESLRALIDAGHELGNHSFHHEPRFLFCSRGEIEREVLETEERILSLGSEKPLGFRGPGYAWNRDLIEVLLKNNYLYDATTFPTHIGPLARAYYFRTSKLTERQRWERRQLFGGFRQGWMPCKAYCWQVESGSKLIEIPVTTVPIIKTPFHLSYLIYLNRFSVALSAMYLKIALSLCRLMEVEPSFLLHPLDFTDKKRVPDLAFFPGMLVDFSRKMELFHRVIRILSQNYRLVNMSTYANAFIQSGKVKTRPI